MQKRRKVLVVDDYEGLMHSLVAVFESAQVRGFQNYKDIDSNTLEVLNSIDLVPVHNSAAGKVLDPAVDLLLKDDIAGVISDCHMPSTRYYQSASKDQNSVQSSEGGLQMAKIAKIAGVPVVVYTASPDAASEGLKKKRMGALNPAGEVAVFNKTDYEGMFVELARQIAAKEAGVSNMLGR